MASIVPSCVHIHGKYGYRLMNQKKKYIYIYEGVGTVRSKYVFKVSSGSAANPRATGVPT